MPMLKLKHLNNYYLLKVKVADKALFDDPTMQRITGELLVQMRVQPFNENPDQRIIDASVEVNADGVQELILKAATASAGTVHDEEEHSDAEAPPPKRLHTMDGEQQVDGDFEYNLIDKHDTKFILVEGLPLTPHFEPVFDEDFTGNIKNSYPYHNVREIVHLKKGSNPTAIVEMDSCDAVSDIIKLDILFEQKMLKMSKYFPEPPANNTQISDEVLMTGVPGPILYENYFLELVGVHLTKAGVSGAGQPVLVGNYNCDTSSLTLKFPSVAIATQFVNYSEGTSTPFRYRGAKIVCTQISLPRNLTSKVQLFNVLMPFDKDILIRGLREALLEAGSFLVREAHTPPFIVSIGDYDAGNKSIVLELSSPDAAYEVCSLTTFDYNYERVYFQAYADETIDDDEIHKILIQGVIKPYCPVTLKKGLMLALGKAVGEGEDPIVNCGPLSEKGAVIVEVDSEEVADAICNLKFKYNFISVTFKRIKVDEQAPKTQMCQPVMRTDWPYFETSRLLILCIKYREIVHNFRHKEYSKTWDIIKTSMDEQGLFYSIESMKGRLKSALNWFPRCGAKWPLRDFVLEFHGQKAAGSAALPAKYLPIREGQLLHKEPAAKSVYGIRVMDDYSDKSTEDDWNYNSDIALLQEYKRLKPKFDDTKTKASELYAEIADILVKAGHKKITAEKCSNRMGSLADTYKRKYDDLRKTGSSNESINWVYYDQFSRLFENTAIAEPQRLVIFGSSFGASTRNDSKSHHKLKKSTTPPEQRERKLQVGEAILTELQKFNATYAAEVEKKL